jgi:hypothetical protein
MYASTPIAQSQLPCSNCLCGPAASYVCTCDVITGTCTWRGSIDSAAGTSNQSRPTTSQWLTGYQITSCMYNPHCPPLHTHLVGLIEELHLPQVRHVCFPLCPPHGVARRECHQQGVSQELSKGAYVVGVDRLPGGDHCQQAREDLGLVGGRHIQGDLQKGYACICGEQWLSA